MGHLHNATPDPNPMTPFQTLDMIANLDSLIAIQGCAPGSYAKKNWIAFQCFIHVEILVTD